MHYNPQNVLDDDEVIDEAEASAITGLACATLRKQRCLGGGPEFLKLGRRVRYLRSKCREWRDARLASSTSDADARLPRRLTEPRGHAS
jgi:hypothetical protein